MLFKIDPLFKGFDDLDQLKRIAEFFGSDAMFTYLKRHQRVIDQNMYKFVSEFNQTEPDWAKFITDENAGNFDERAIDLLSKMLKIDYLERITAGEALKHPYFRGQTY